MRFLRLLLVSFVLGSATLATTAHAAIKQYRWENQFGLSDSLQQILVALNRESGLALTYKDFSTFERRDMARYRFTTYVQLYNGLPVDGAMIRTWADLTTGHIVQLEAHLDDGQTNAVRAALVKKFSGARTFSANLNSMSTMRFINQVVSNHRDDRQIRGIKERDQWHNNELERVIEVRGRRGTHTIIVSHTTRKIVSATYNEFPQADLVALVYPIYEETEKDHKIQRRQPMVLKNLVPYRKESATDPYGPLRTRQYLESKIDPVKGETPEGQAQGFWSPSWLTRTGAALYDTMPWVENTFANGQLLIGKYVTINLHPEVTKFTGIKFPLKYSGNLNFMWKASLVNGVEQWEVFPTSSYHGMPIADAGDLLARPASRTANHDPVTYINEGFDEIQVYYAVDRFIESLHGQGFSDPELSTRPFHAYLYDPDISMRDNAYYTNDTINFTTYSPDAQNFARDNSTIWHELGHGIMDRLMGDRITLADTGGLSEGMADFLAQLVVNDVSGGQSFAGSEDFRIVNSTGFHLTNEVHDDGEAYGGAMKDIMDLAIQKYGRKGLLMMTDLTLDAMRLARNHPGLTAAGWFEHMLFADELGNPGVRAPLAMNDLILRALGSRNFRFDGGSVAQFAIDVESARGSRPLLSMGPGSRGQPIYHELKAGDEATYQLLMKVVSAEAYKFKYPVTIEVSYNGGPLQGGVKWKDEAAGPVKYFIATEGDLARVNVGAVPGCDFSNRDDGSCVDYAYIKVFNDGDTKPFSKKRFYLRVK